MTRNRPQLIVMEKHGEIFFFLLNLHFLLYLVIDPTVPVGPIDPIGQIMETAIAIMAVTFLGEVATLKILMQWFLVMHRSTYLNSVPSYVFDIKKYCKIKLNDKFLNV